MILSLTPMYLYLCLYLLKEIQHLIKDDSESDPGVFVFLFVFAQIDSRYDQ